MATASEHFSSTGADLRVEPVHWDGLRRVALIGEIDLSNVDRAEAALIDLASSGTPVTLDLLGLSYLDSQGVAMLFRLAERAHLNGGTLTLANPHDPVRRVLVLTNVADVALIVDDI